MLQGIQPSSRSMRNSLHVRFQGVKRSFRSRAVMSAEDPRSGRESHDGRRRHARAHCGTYAVATGTRVFDPE